MIATALGGTYARSLGYIEGDTLTRIVVGANGLMIAWFGNRMPKLFVPSARARQARRAVGWSMVLSGLAYTILWVFAPIQTAVWMGTAAIIAGLAASFGYCLALRHQQRAA
ncbi:MAG: ammonium transporter [Sphingomonas sp.]|nr:ammonium transporter [Sphingomonas sp.]